VLGQRLGHVQLLVRRRVQVDMHLGPRAVRERLGDVGLAAVDDCSTTQ
jgi:hypothetical protein